MKITNHIATTYGLDIQKAAGNNKAAEKSEKVKKSDTVAVSKEAKNISATAASVETATNRISSLPDSRADRVAEVKERINNGFYNTEEFRSQLADKLIKTITNPTE